MFEFAGPALIHVHAPSPERHGFAPAQAFTQASLALKARLLPLFRYDPTAEGVFGSRISLAGNPDPQEMWSKVEEDIITPADWAIREHRFAPYFSLLKDDDPAPLPIADYLKLEATARRGKTPIVTVVMNKNDDNEEITRWQVKPELVAACEERLEAWRTL